MFNNNIHWYHIQHPLSSPYLIIQGHQKRNPNEQKNQKILTINKENLISSVDLLLAIYV